MHEAIILEKTELLRSLTTKENFVKIAQTLLKPLWSIHNKDSFEQICNELDNQIKLLQNEGN